MDEATRDLQKIAIIDFGGQYAHLIGSRVRSLGVYSVIWGPDLEEYRQMSAEERRTIRGVILSGGPESVYDEGAVRVHRDVYDLGLPVLGICYGHQLMMHDLGGEVRPGNIREYGPANLEVLEKVGPFAASLDKGTRVWMSHGDEVSRLPEGFVVAARTEDCAFAGVADEKRRFYGVQFHPEVTHTESGQAILNLFLEICAVDRGWDLDRFIARESEILRRQVGERNVFMLVSGGVDSTVAYALLARAIGEKRIYPLFVDTGLMRYQEAEEVRDSLAKIGLNINAATEAERYFNALKGVTDPEKKRAIIGRLFIEIQQEVSRRLELNPDQWLLGQGTIYPDTIESGGTRHADTIKTHHNRVPEVEALIKAGLVVEPIRELYKNEVRELGLHLGLDRQLVERQPFPGPGLGVRVLCRERGENFSSSGELPRIQSQLNDFLTNWRSGGPGREGIRVEVLPVRSVGVKGDKRSYEHPAAVFLDPDSASGSPAQEPPWDLLDELGTALPNRVAGINRVLWGLPGASQAAVARESFPCELTPGRVTRLQVADRVINDFQLRHQLLREIWQFPVVLVPLFQPAERTAPADGLPPESLVLRPVQSSEAMTVNFYPMPGPLLSELSRKLTGKLDWLSEVFYDITHKPPGTIEWE